jgi:hypothetical protein
MHKLKLLIACVVLFLLMVGLWLADRKAFERS